jgi:uncharacterized membrane protein YesL
MRNALQIAWAALGLWWQEFVLFLACNLAWLALQIPIITGPPATVAMYVLAGRLADGELVEFSHFARALRQHLAPAWRWGFLNLLVYAAVLVNFYAYQGFSGGLWTFLRIVWAAIGLIWFVLNLFYWPFWLRQEDRSFRATIRNCLVLAGRRPLQTLILGLLCLFLAIFGILTTLPLAACLISWLALIGTVGVQRELEPKAS